MLLQGTETCSGLQGLKVQDFQFLLRASLRVPIRGCRGLWVLGFVGLGPQVGVLFRGSLAKSNLGFGV